MPLSLFFMEKLTDDNGKNVKFFVALVLSLSALILTHFQYGLMLVPHLVLIMLLKRLFVKRFDVKAFLVIPLSVLISSVSTFPLLYYIYTEGQVWSSAAPTIPFSTPLKSLYFFSGKGIGALTFLMIITSFAFLCMSIFNSKKTGSTWKSNRYLPYVISAAVSLVQFYAIYVTGRISSALNVISGKYAVFAMFFVSPVIASYVVTEFKRMSASKGLSSSNSRTTYKSFFKSRNFWTSVMVILALISILLTYHWFQPPPARWSEAYEAINDSALASANSWFRAETIPRHPSQMVMQMESGISTLQGWFGKVGAKENKILLQLNHFDISHEDPTLVEKLFHDPNYDPDPAIRALRIFNVKYIMVDKTDPVSSSSIRETTSRIVSSFNRSNLVKPVYADGEIFVFELQETYQIMASTNAFVMSDENLTSFYQVISNKSFSPSLGIFLSQSTTVEGMTFKEWDGSFENDGYVNATINEIETNSMSIKFHLTVDRDCFVTIPISYSSFLKVEIDNSEVKMLKALPALVSVQVPAGTHSIILSRLLTPLEVGSLAVSIITLICLIALLPICRLRKKMPTQTSLQVHVSKSKTYTHGGNNTRNEILKRHRLPKSDRENIYNCE
jgi:hypothetical protein